MVIGMNKWKTVVSICVGVILLGVILTFYGTFSLNDEFKFESQVYTIGDGYVKGISPYTEVSLFLDYFDINDCSVKVLDLDNKEINTGYVMNGSSTVVLDNSGKAIASYRNVVVGDVIADGRIAENDLVEFGRYLVSEDLLGMDTIVSLDVNGDNKVQLVDLLLFDRALESGYEGIEVEEEEFILQSNEVKRVIARVKPSYAIDYNVRWSSSDSAIVTVSDSGKITGNQEGEAVVVATTVDGAVKREIKVKVDNTIQLESYYGTLYIGGSELVVPIKAIDYEGITCSSSHPDITECSIDGRNLVLKQKNSGIVKITVSSSKYGSCVYEAETIYPQFNLISPYWCVAVNTSGYSIVSSFNIGKLSFEVLNPEIITNVYEGQGKVHFTVGNQAGRGEVIVKESNGNMTRSLVLDVYRLYIPEIGQFGTVGQEMVTDIIAENGTLRCTSRDPAMATCRIEDNKLYVQPLQVGQVIIDVINVIEYKGQYFKCGTEDFLAVIQEGS